MSVFTVLLSNADQCAQQFFKTIVEVSHLQDINCIWRWIDELHLVEEEML